MTLRADAKRKDLAKFLGNEYSVLQVIAQDLENTLRACLKSTVCRVRTAIKRMNNKRDRDPTSL